LTSPTHIDWAALRREAQQIAERAYAPYSGLSVGAAAFTDTGRIVVGCNVENASYGLTLCAECSLVSDLHRHGDSSLIAVSITGNGTFLMPCGRCRQLLHEAGGAELLVDTEQGPLRLAELLPHVFGPDDLPHPG
jgi:cytidine deaminase